MINQTQIEQAKAIDCRLLITAFFPLSSQNGAEWMGACPWCGGDDRFHVKANGWFCREGGGHCERKGDAIKFIQERERLDFPRAVDFLLRWNGAQPLSPVRQQQKNELYRGEDWQWSAGQEVRIARTRLLEGLPYLASRGITQATAEAYRLGYTDQGWYGKGDLRPAITVPWYDGDIITHVKYRFLRPDPDQEGKKGKRYQPAKYPKNASGSMGKPVLFRPPTRRSNVAVFCEGELNAISIYQATPYDPYAVGSQSVTPEQLEAVRQVAATYEWVIVWTDEEAPARKIASVIPGAIIKKSPAKDGNEYDANTLLQTNQLSALIDAWLSLFPVCAKEGAHKEEAKREEANREEAKEEAKEEAYRILSNGDAPAAQRGAACRLLDYLDGRHDNRESAQCAAEILQNCRR